MDPFDARAIVAIAAFTVIGAASVVVSAQQQPATILACIARADRETLLTGEEIHQLCYGATSEGPSICYEAADRLTLSNLEAIRLCRCAKSDRPVKCFQEVRDRTDQWIDPSIAFCNEITVRHLRFDCAPIEPSL